jgi:hypothetical protein
MLRGPGFCITPYQIKFSRSGTWIQLRGYAKWQFADLFARYGSVYPPPKCQSVTNADGAGTSGVTLSDFAKAASVKVSPNPMPPVTPLTPGDTHGDTLKNSRNPDGTGAGDTLTPSEGVERAKGIEEPTLPGMLDPARVRQLVDWYRKQAKALRAEMSPGTLQVHLKQQLRETLAEELVADLVDDTANRIAKAATTRRRKQGAAP